MQFNEDFFLPIFLRHYAKYFPLKNIYIIDHGSTTDLVPQEVNRIFIPRDRPFSEQDRCDLVKCISTGLLKYYDYGVFADSDELIALELLDEEELKIPHVIYVAGFDTWLYANSLDRNQRLMGLIDPYMCKPLIFTEVPDWGLGFHVSSKHSPSEQLSIPMAHIRFLYPDKIQDRINTRAETHQNMVVNEKKLGVSFHWENGNKNLSEFYDSVKSLEDRNSAIQEFTMINRELLFEKVPGSYGINARPPCWAAKSGHSTHDIRYNLSRHFPHL